MSLETVPKDLRNLRACLLCSLVKEDLTVAHILIDYAEYAHFRNNYFTVETLGELFDTVSPELIKFTIDQFEYDGCDNCEEFLHMKNNRDAVYECTSSSFDGVIALMSPEDSWVAKWQRINRHAKGVYGISVTGRLPPGIISDLKSKGIMYRSRDLSSRT